MPRLYKSILAWIVVVVFAIACVTCSFFHFAKYHGEPPKGCDQFGYLYQAQAIREGRLFSSHTARPFLKPLVAKLSSDNPNADDYRWMIAPHAYHYSGKAGGIINQYPPGTALGLSLFPAGAGNLFYPALVTLSMTLLLLLLVRKEPEDVLMYGGAILFFAAFQMVQTPFSNEYRSVGSVAPTFALLFAAGWFLRKNPLAAVALVSATVVVRIANAWLLPAIAVVYVFHAAFFKDERPTLRDMFIRSAKAVAATLACGVMWIMLYQWALLGNPLAPTYSEIDSSSATLADFMSNLRFYFVDSDEWLVVNLALAAIICLVYFGKGRRRWIVWAVLLIAWNYAFFLTHKVAISYYPFASAIVIAGLLLSGLDFAGKKMRAALALIFIILEAGIFVRSWEIPEKDFLQNYSKDATAYRQTFDKAAVVWGDVSTGTVEYTTRKAGMRFFWGTDRARFETMNFLQENGYVQAVYIDDGGMRPDEAIAALKGSGLAFKVEVSPRFGRIAWIFADAKK
jgi:hypothetical protein